MQNLRSIKHSVLFILLMQWSCWLVAAEKPVPVRVAEVTSKPLQQRLSLPGEIITRRISRLSSQVDAMVVDVLVEAGDYVNQGQILLRLDDELRRFDLQRSAAALLEAKAQLQESKRQRSEFSRLVGKNFIANTSFEASEAKVRIDAAVVKRLDAEMQRNQALLERHRIKAPFSGVISEKRVEVGQWIKVDNHLLTLVDNRNLRVSVDVPQRYFSYVALNTSVKIVPDPLPTMSLNAKVSHIVPVADATSHHFPVHIDVVNDNLQLMPGMSVRVQLLTGTEGRRSVLWLPRDALVKQPGGPDSVWLVNPDGQDLRVQRIELTTGQVSNNQVEIVVGDLTAGDRVVVRGNEILKPGQTVRVIP